MTIDWTDAALEAALIAHDDSTGDDGSKQAMRAALDAAAEAQGMTAGWINRAVDDAYAEGRADALEEAAKLCACRCNEIRALKEKQG